MVRAGSSQRSYRPHPPSATYSRSRQWSAGSSGGRSEACGYRWITMQVRVRVTPSTTWMGRPPAAQLIQTGRLNPGDEVVGAGEILGQLHTIQVAERLATWATLAPSVSMSTYALSIRAGLLGVQPRHPLT
jgi:hypothetical protein